MKGRYFLAAIIVILISAVFYYQWSTRPEKTIYSSGNRCAEKLTIVRTLKNCFSECVSEDSLTFYFKSKKLEPKIFSSSGSGRIPLPVGTSISTVVLEKQEFFPGDHREAIVSFFADPQYFSEDDFKKLGECLLSEKKNMEEIVAQTWGDRSYGNLLVGGAMYMSAVQYKDAIARINTDGVFSAPYWGVYGVSPYGTVSGSATDLKGNIFNGISELSAYSVDREALEHVRNKQGESLEQYLVRFKKEFIETH